jgi:DNA-binding transcriptional MerR regulator
MGETKVAIRNSQEPREGTGKLYYSISEVAELVNVKAHVLRYWETQFKMLHPRKNRAGNRSYRVKDVKMALRIKRLLYDEGFTIAGARRKILDERRSRDPQTELNFVGISREDFVKMLRRDLGELLQVVQGERSFDSLGQRDEGEEQDGHRRRGGIFSDLELGDGADESEAEADAEEAAGEALEEGEESEEIEDVLPKESRSHSQGAGRSGGAPQGGRGLAGSRGLD